MRHVGSFIIKNWLLLAIAVIAISAVFAYFTPELHIEEDESTWFSEKDPILKTYHEFQEIFVTNETAIIAYTTDNALTGPELKYCSDLTKKLKKIPYVIDAISLATVDDIRGTEEGLEIEPLVKRNYFKEVPQTFLKERIAANPFFTHVLISEDHRTVGIVLQLEWTDEDKEQAGDISRKVTGAIKKILHDEKEKTGRQFYLGGNIITDAEVSRMVERDMYRFFPLSLVLAALILFVIFRDFFSIIFPLISVSLALLWTLGLKGIFNSPITPVSTTLFGDLFIGPVLLVKLNVFKKRK